MVISAKSLEYYRTEPSDYLIKEQGIHYVFFVVTYIDAVSDEEEEKDKMIQFIRQRISGSLLKRAKKCF